MNKILAFFITFLLMFVAVSLSRAEDTDSVAKKYNISFPVAELGNCGSIDECKSFCADSANQQTCVDFAKKHRFYKDDEAKKRQDEILAAAKGKLGCSTEAECKAFCGEQENWIKCGEFAKQHGLGGANNNQQGDQRKLEMLQRAKEFLGCNSYDECKNFCQNPDNHQKCEEFGRIINPQVRPLQNGTEEASRGGCTSATCRAYCNKYPDHCRQFSAGGKEHSVPDRSACQNLREKMGSASAEEIKAYYLKNCLPVNYQGLTPSTNLEPPSPKPSFDLESKCKSYPGCTWNGASCQCSPPTATYSPTSSTTNVRGISTEENLLQKILHLLGF